MSDALTRLFTQFAMPPDGWSYTAICAGLTIAIIGCLATLFGKISVPALSPIPDDTGSDLHVRRLKPHIMSPDVSQRRSLQRSRIVSLQRLGWRWFVYMPMLSISLGFAFATGTSIFWIAPIALLIAGSAEFATRILQYATKDADNVSPLALTVVSSFAVTFLFGSLFVARLNVTRNPNAHFTAGADPDLVGESLLGSIFKLTLVPAASLLILGALYSTMRGKPRWITQTKAAHSFAKLGQCSLERAKHLVKYHANLLTFASALVTLVLYGAAAFGPEQPLKIGKFATPEYAKIAYFFTLALILSSHGHRYRLEPDGSTAPTQQTSHSDIATPTRSRSDPNRITHRHRSKRLLSRFRGNQHLWAPVALFVAVAIVNVFRGDMGPIIPVLIATCATLLIVVRQQAMNALRLSKGSERDRARYEFQQIWTYSRRVGLYASIVGVIAAGVLGVLFLSFNHLTGRIDAWQDPWAFPWKPECVEVPAEGWPKQPPAATPDITLEQGNTVEFPHEDSEGCLQSFQAYTYSNQSQIAQGLAGIADGGLWGRGLRSTASSTIPAARFDLILAPIWSKLGGIVVALLSVLLALLGYALVRLGTCVGTTSAAGMSAPSIYAVGFGWLIVAQYAFQVAMTINAFPHSGITAPLLSEGPQANATLVAGVIIAVWGVYATTRGTPMQPDETARSRAAWLRPRLPATTGALVLNLALIAAVTISPYQGLPEDRAACSISSDVDPLEDPTECSTDLTASTSPAATSISIDGRSAFTYEGVWHTVDGSPLHGSDMAGLLLPNVLGGVVNGAVGTATSTTGPEGIWRRILPPSRHVKQVTVDLTIDPGLQKAVAAAATEPGTDGSVPLPAGVVVVKASTGKVLASVSTPARGEDGALDQVMPGGQSKRNEYNVRMNSRWYVDGNLVTLDDCKAAVEAGKLCARWQAKETGFTPLRDERRARYVAGADGVALPKDDVNRAFDKGYGLGSTFKVIIAATYLRNPAARADDLIPAPLTSEADGFTFRNNGRGECPGTTKGSITLTEAVAYSCNTAFIELAKTMGWDSIRATALDFGFQLPGAETRGAWLAGAAIGAPSVVPAQANGAELAIASLGGGAVLGTPLQMATALGVVANKGWLTQPTLVQGIDADQRALPIPTQSQRQVLTPEAAEQLRLALSLTSKIGTARLLKAPNGHPVFVKTGTHEIIEDGDPIPRGQFERQIAWIVGFVDDYAFAIAITTRDEQAGAQRSRHLTQTIIDYLIEG